MDKEKYIQKFMEDEKNIAEYPEDDKRLAIAIEEFEKTQKKYVEDIDGVEIFATGKWNGDEYTDLDLDQLVESFNELGGIIKPYVKLGHNGEQTLLQKDGLPAAGWITGLRRQGNKLIAKFSNVPSKIAELIRRKAYGRVSSEIYWNMKHNDKTYPRALKAVALLGADTPAVTSLDDFINLYTEEIDAETRTYIYNGEALMEESKKVDEIQLVVKEYSQKIEDMKKQNEKLAQEKEELKSYIEKEKKSMHESRVNAFISKWIDEGKMLPAQEHFYRSILSDSDVKSYSYISDNVEKTISGNNMEIMEKILESMPKIVEFSAESHNVQPEKSLDLKNDDEILDEKVRAYIKEHPEVSYADAFTQISYEGV